MIKWTVVFRLYNTLNGTKNLSYQQVDIYILALTQYESAWLSMFQNLLTNNYCNNNAISVTYGQLHVLLFNFAYRICKIRDQNFPEIYLIIRCYNY